MPAETDRIEAIRARHAARLRTRAARGDGSVQMSTLVDDDMVVLLAEVDHVQGVNDDLNHEITNCRVLEYEARMKEAERKVASQRRVLGAAEAAAREPGATGRDVKKAMDAAWIPSAALAPVAPDAEPGGDDRG